MSGTPRLIGRGTLLGRAERVFRISQEVGNVNCLTLRQGSPDDAAGSPQSAWRSNIDKAWKPNWLQIENTNPAGDNAPSASPAALPIDQRIEYCLQINDG
jgi:hypothetical protein